MPPARARARPAPNFRHTNRTIGERNTAVDSPGPGQAQKMRSERVSLQPLSPLSRRGDDAGKDREEPLGWQWPPLLSTAGLVLLWLGGGSLSPIFQHKRRANAGTRNSIKLVSNVKQCDVFRWFAIGRLLVQTTADAPDTDLRLNRSDQHRH